MTGRLWQLILKLCYVPMDAYDRGYNDALDDVAKEIPKLHRRDRP